ncbi:uncharacterized protein G2W53_039707 [Senna tora]|uniref:Uncharacterized protein n=1 Tax=Senna tora TaxID=362788 RepID=A0A834W6D6_9FABA|nr:uncharacterized protein G2W53_039707 [Senna tora]
MTWNTFKAITSPIRAINPLGFPKNFAKRSFSLTCATTFLNLYLLSSFEIHSRFSIPNMFRHNLTFHPSNHEPHSSIKSIRIPKYNAKRSFSITCSTTHLNLFFFSSFEIQSRFSIHNLFRHDLTHFPCNHEPHSSIKSALIPKYNAKQSTFHVITIPIRELNQLGFPNTTRSDRHDLTHLPCDHEPHLSIKYTRIPKYNAKRAFRLTCAITRLNLYFLCSFEIQPRFSIHNVFGHNFTHLPSDHEPHSSIKSTRIPKYNAKRNDWIHLPSDHEPHSSIKSNRIPKYNEKRSV